MQSRLIRAFESIRQQLAWYGWKFEPLWLPDGKANTNCIQVGYSRYPTFVHPWNGVKIALTTNQRYIANHTVYTMSTFMDEKTNRITLAAIISTDRRKRKATRAMVNLTCAARNAAVELVLEPVPMRDFKIKGERSITRKKLVQWYKRFGFKPLEENPDTDMLMSLPIEETRYLYLVVWKEDDKEQQDFIEATSLDELEGLFLAKFPGVDAEKCPDFIIAGARKMQISEMGPLTLYRGDSK